MIAIIIGVVLLGIGGFLEYSRRKALAKVLEIKYHQTTNAATIFDTYESIVQSLGQGNYTELVELSGLAKTTQPLEAEHSKSQVVFYRASVIREYEVKEQERDDKGNVRWVTRRATETISSNERATPFYLDDNSGKQILVDMEGAEKYLQKSLDRFERELPQGGAWGAFVSNIADSKTIGYRFVEEVIPLNARLYVLGEASDRRGELAVMKPREPKNQFIVSTKSEEELVSSLEGNAKMSLAGAIALAIIGLGAIVYGIVNPS